MKILLLIIPILFVACSETTSPKIYSGTYKNIIGMHDFVVEEFYEFDGREMIYTTIDSTHNEFHTTISETIFRNDSIYISGTGYCIVKFNDSLLLVSDKNVIEGLKL